MAKTLPVIAKSDLKKVEVKPKPKTYQDGLDEGREQGRLSGYEKGNAEGAKNGYATGKEKGLKEGNAKGYRIGYEKGIADTYPQAYWDGGVFISHRYVAAIELKLAEADGYSDPVKWRKQAKIPAWWIAAIMTLSDPLDEMHKEQKAIEKERSNKEVEQL